jgi:predicted transcriptional regulator
MGRALGRTEKRAREAASDFAPAMDEWTAYLQNDCGGSQFYEYRDGDLVIRHSCHAGKQVREMYEKLKFDHESEVQRLREMLSHVMSLLHGETCEVCAAIIEEADNA